MISTRLFTLFALAASCPLSQALFTPPQNLDVWSPTIYYPHDGTVWNTGEVHHVKWYVDTSSYCTVMFTSYS